MKFLVFIFIINGFCAHDVQVAFFKIHQENEKLMMDVVMEKEDVERTFDELGILLTESSFQNYLQENLIMIINNENQIICFDNMQINDKHITMACNVNEVNENITSLKLNNSCLLNIENHSNIIEIRVNDKQRDFLMNMERTSISVNY